LAIALAGYQLLAPDLLVPECANVLWKKVRRGEMEASAAHAAQCNGPGVQVLSLQQALEAAWLH
jgi:predicted nucleic acid-binding protein